MPTSDGKIHNFPLGVVMPEPDLTKYRLIVKATNLTTDPGATIQFYNGIQRLVEELARGEEHPFRNVYDSSIRMEMTYEFRTDTPYGEMLVLLGNYVKAQQHRMRVTCTFLEEIAA